MNPRHHLKLQKPDTKETYYWIPFIEIQEQAKSVYGDEGQNGGDLSEGIGGTKGNHLEC